MELGGRLIYHAKAYPVSEKLNNRSLWKSLFTSPHWAVNRATSYSDDRDDSPSKKLKFGILNPLGYSNFSTKAGYRWMNFGNFGPFFKVKSIILWTSTTSTDVVPAIWSDLSDLVLDPLFFSKSIVLIWANHVSACIVGNRLFLGRNGREWSAGPPS